MACDELESPSLCKTEPRKHCFQKPGPVMNQLQDTILMGKLPTQCEHPTAVLHTDTLVESSKTASLQQVRRNAYIYVLMEAAKSLFQWLLIEQL